MSDRVRTETTPPASSARGAVLTLALTLTLGACTEEEVPTGADNPIDSTSQGALMTAPTKAPRTIAAMMFDIGGGAPNATSLMTLIGGTGTSQRHMYQEISYGIQDLAPSYFGPYTLPVMNCLTIACCGPSSDKTGNGATVQSLVDALGMTYNHYFWIYGHNPSLPAGANCGTWGDEGSPNKIAVYSNYSFDSIVGYAQEIGHNFGMTHEPIMKCTGNATFLDNTASCTHNEYGNSLSFMGGGAHHPSAYHKLNEGWIGGCNVVKAPATTTITLVPQELPCNGVQLVQIPAPKTRAAPAAGDRQGTAPMLTHYYLEMRAPLGFDAGLGPMVLVSIGPDLPTPTRAAPYLYLLDMNAATATLNDAGLTAGKSYSDPSGGFTVMVNSIDSSSANVTITTSGTGASTCVDGTAFSAPGPDATSCGPLSGGGSGTGGSTGAAGTSGAAGRGGTTGTGGRGGTTGTGGRGGAGGTATAGTTGTGSAGTTGTGTAGTTGTGTAGTNGPGIAGTSGAGTAGTSGTGTAGTTGTATGTAGTTGTATGAAGSSAQTGATGGCACDATAGGSGARGSWAAFACLAVMGSIARRRSRRAARS